MSKIRVFVVDDHALFRAGLIGLLDDMPDLKVVGEAANGRDAIDLILKVKPDVVLLDVNMPVMNGIETIIELRRLEYQKPVIMLTISKHDDDLLGAIKAGAEGYLLKNSSPQELYKAILNVNQGQAVLSPEVTHNVIRAVTQVSSSGHSSGLSQREYEVLKCMARGKTTNQIGGELFISENTVKTHVRHILKKMNASNRTEAVSQAAKLGILKQE